MGKLEIMKEDLDLHPVMQDIKSIDCASLESHSDKPKIKFRRIATITAILLIALLYVTARIR